MNIDRVPPDSYIRFLYHTNYKDSDRIRLYYESIRIWALHDGSRDGLVEMEANASGRFIGDHEALPPDANMIDNIMRWKDKVDDDDIESFQNA